MIIGSFYHYTTADRWIKIQSGESYDESGLVPVGRFLDMTLVSRFGLPKKASEAAIFGFLEPIPKEWLVPDRDYGNKPIFETVIGNLRGMSDELVLLKVDITDKDDVQIADWSPHIADDFMGHREVSAEIMQRVKTDYFSSLKPFSEHQTHGTARHAIPEVVCFSAIPLNRIKPVRFVSRWEIINEARKGSNLPLVTPRPKPRSDLLHQIFGGPDKEPEEPTSGGGTVLHFQAKPPRPRR